MTTITDLFPSKYLKAADAEPALTLTIAKVTKETMKNRDGEDEIKPVISFTESTKSMVLNATNAKVLAELYGETIESWTGQRVTLCSVEVDRSASFRKPCASALKPPKWTRRS
jgi:hypothetical protein